MKEALVVTADGQAFRGVSVGADGVAAGEVIFNTSMTGYQEILTDPSYAAQVVVMTSSHIGNYGVTDEDAQAPAPVAAGLIVRAFAAAGGGWRARGSLGDYLIEHGLVAVAEVDTRRLTRHIRDRGAMGVAMGSGHDEGELRSLAEAVPPMTGHDLASKVTTRRAYEVAAVPPRRGRVVALDLGMKRDILTRLSTLGLTVQVVPLDTPADTILQADPDGLFLSNGPGDPEPLRGPVETVRALLGRIPVFGICLGHQVLGLALGAQTYKLPFGHHGGNHPVKRLADGGVEVTAHNHGFAVDLAPLAGDADPAGDVISEFGRVRATHRNLNDGTLEGLACRDVPAFSVQYHPEAAPGPHDGLRYFGQFLELMEESV